jgi:hypothetical protein
MDTQVGKAYHSFMSTASNTRAIEGLAARQQNCVNWMLLLLLFIFPRQQCIAADEPPDGPKRIFKDDFIENLIGDWKLTRKIRGNEVQNTVKVEWVLNHQFLQIHMKDITEPPTYEALVLIGYSYGDKQYIAHWCDTYGGKVSAIGYGKRSGDSIEFEFQYPDGPFYNTFAWDAKVKGWIFRMESQDKDGKRVFFAEDTLRRRMSSPQR